jgi:acetoacetate decarboxylase
MEYAEGASQTNGRVLRTVPGEWLLPFLHQRYDDTSSQGIEIELGRRDAAVA